MCLCYVSFTHWLGLGICGKNISDIPGIGSLRQFYAVHCALARCTHRHTTHTFTHSKASHFSNVHIQFPTPQNLMHSSKCQGNSQANTRTQNAKCNIECSDAPQVPYTYFSFFFFQNMDCAAWQMKCNSRHASKTFHGTQILLCVPHPEIKADASHRGGKYGSGRERAVKCKYNGLRCWWVGVSRHSERK